jgi:hypothetical protein
VNIRFKIVEGRARLPETRGKVTNRFRPNECWILPILLAAILVIVMIRGCVSLTARYSKVPADAHFGSDRGQRVPW